MANTFCIVRRKEGGGGYTYIKTDQERQLLVENNNNPDFGVLSMVPPLRPNDDEAACYMCVQSRPASVRSCPAATSGGRNPRCAAGQKW